ncbi:MAG TPA: hypothetical protein VMO76_17550, partial [Candidatus Udaeobacter sp.]|nr:hypothetical protein [Candidatus Udaeobacter sp.]
RVWDRRYFDAGPGFRNLPLGQKQTISNAAERGLTEAKKKTLSHGAGNVYSVGVRHYASVIPVSYEL